MADRARTPHPRSGARQPLAEINHNADYRATTRPSKPAPSPATTLAKPILPHNESLEPNGTLAVRSSSIESPVPQRAAQTVADESKRLSTLSTTSTNASARPRKAYIGHWQLGRTIGKGGCSRVRVVRHKNTLQYGAVKIVTRNTAESTRAQSLANLIESSKSSISIASGHKPIPYGLEREIAVMKLLEHPNIVRLYDVWENRNELYLIMEYVDGGELFHYVDDRKGLDEDEAVYIFRQIVAALLYCHKLLICHRDLKPENILLNQEELTVKIIDFGMAALQPQGRLLSTPCGSPHYAAPEVVSSRPYDGKQADVWSCGVILYVMLTGTTPYNYSPTGDIRPLFRDIARARYYMPPNLSSEAQDLIRRIFVPDPRRRITMDEIWDHPLLHKYDKRFGFDGPSGSKEAAIGPIPTVGDFRLKHAQDVDREILRNMRTLWHSEPEQSLVQKLLNEEMNQEKLFYAALIKHREENLENYCGGEDMEYSKSDYHHAQAHRLSDPPQMPAMPAQRTQSHFSILNDEHLKSKQSNNMPPPPIPPPPPPSVSSYDPYRASKDPIVDSKENYINVVVHRKGSSSTRQSGTSKSLRHPHALRIEMLKQARGGSSRRASERTTSSMARSGRSRSSMQRSSISRPSLISSNVPSSPPVIATMRPSELHKRGVSFTHLRRVSSVSQIAAIPNSESLTSAPSLPDTFRERRIHRPSNPVPPSSSPPITPANQQQIRSKKPQAETSPGFRARARHSKTPSQSIRNDIRKHSAELEKACEEAFFTSSVRSSLTGATLTFSEKAGLCETPPSSISRLGSAGAVQQQFSLKSPPNRHADPQQDTPNTYLVRTLEETRDKLAAYRTSEDGNAARFDEVVRLLETIMPGSRAPPTTSPSKRAASAPEPQRAESLAALPAITEENDTRISTDAVANWQRAVTSPVTGHVRAAGKTIRMVPVSSPSVTVAPLMVNKRSTISESSSTSTTNNGVHRSNVQRKQEQALLGSVREQESEADPPPQLRKKRSAWFGMAKKSEDQIDKASKQAPASPVAQEMESLKERKGSRSFLKRFPEPQQTDDAASSEQSSEFPIRKKRFGGSKNAFSKWLNRKDSDQDQTRTPIPAATIANAQSHRSLDSMFSSLSSEDDAPPASGPERSWFARFFHIKPAAKIICFTVPRGRARQEMTVLLREWERHGMRDVECSRNTNTITARVDRSNALGIKPVSFRVELFVVLEHGRRSGMSIARFVQTKGNANAFKRTIDVVEEVMRSRSMLVTDEEKWRALCEIVAV